MNTVDRLKGEKTSKIYVCEVLGSIPSTADKHIQICE
jgi:hypothetical protein